MIKMSNLSAETRSRIMHLGGIIEDNIYENDLIRVWFNKELMTITQNNNLYYLGYKGETTVSPEEELPLAVRFLLNYTVKYHVNL